MDTFLKFLVGFVGAALAIVAAGFVLIIPTLIMTALWYCFDDALADLVRYPALGQVPFWPLFAFMWFMGLFGVKKTVKT